MGGARKSWLGCWRVGPVSVWNCLIGFSQLNGIHFFNNSNPGTCVSPYSLRLSPSKSIDFDSHNRLGGVAVFMYFDYHNQALYLRNRFHFNLQNCNYTECSIVISIFTILGAYLVEESPALSQAQGID